MPKQHKYVITVVRTYVETLRQEDITVYATSLDEARCKASDKLTDLIADGKIDANTTESDDYE